FDVTRREVVQDERDHIEDLLVELTSSGIALAITTGGTGLGPRDGTPEATAAVIDRAAPGLAEAMRAAGRAPTPFAALSRGLARRRAAGEEVVMATAVRTEGNPPCRVGQKILVGGSGPIAGTLGCAEFDAAALAGARRVLADGEPATQTYQHELGSIEVYLE